MIARRTTLVQLPERCVRLDVVSNEAVTIYAQWMDERGRRWRHPASSEQDAHEIRGREIAAVRDRADG
jgi:hypothetical protein